MTHSDRTFSAAHYQERASDYVTSAVHASGADLDRIEALLIGRKVGRALDLGCGGGHVAYRAALHADQVVACDVTPGMLEVVARTAEEKGLSNIATRLAAAESLPFETGAFDAVLSRFSCHHWMELEAGLAEARRVTADQGLAVFIDTLGGPDAAHDTHLQAVELVRDPSHIRNRNPSEWLRLLNEADFTVEEYATWRIRILFDSWCERTRTPPENKTVIRALQTGAPARVRQFYALADNGDFDLEVGLFVCRPRR